MSQTLTIARPYARAAFSLAHEHGRLAQWSAALGFAALAVSEPSVNSIALTTTPRRRLNLLMPDSRVYAPRRNSTMLNSPNAATMRQTLFMNWPPPLNTSAPASIALRLARA